MVLRFWAGFQTRRGPYGSVSSPDESDGSVRLTITTEDDTPSPPTPEQAQAVRFLLENERGVGDAVLRGIYAQYPELRDSYGYADEEAAELMPARSIGQSNSDH